MKDTPRAEDFFGKWAGKWDDTWSVQFTITQDPANGDISVLYEWEESVGQQMQMRTHAGKLAGNVLLVGNMIELSIFANDPDQGQAYGRFRKPRTAVLTRQSTARHGQEATSTKPGTRR